MAYHRRQWRAVERQWRASHRRRRRKYGSQLTREQYQARRESYAREALSRARSEQSVGNYPTIYREFTRRGIPESEIRPRENVLTFDAWRALGRHVRKGERGVRIMTMVVTDAERDEAGNVVEQGQRIRRPAYVFHISQTEENGVESTETTAAADGAARFRIEAAPGVVIGGDTVPAPVTASVTPAETPPSNGKPTLKQRLVSFVLGGKTYTRNAAGRCEDAPFCGCCTI